MKRAALALLLSIALLSVGCDDSSSSSPTSQGSTTEELLGALFAPPTEAETTLIASQWAARGVQVEGAVVESAFTMSIALPANLVDFGIPQEWTKAATAKLRIVSHIVDGFRHNGALLVPDGAGPYPVLVFAHPGDNGIATLDLDMFLQSMGSLRDSIAIVIPSFRSEPIDLVSQGTWLSEGTPSPWDRDIEDMRALLRVCARLDAKLDTTRVAVAGYSRGGGVALLAAERDSVFKSVATIAAPTSFQGPWIRELADSLLAGGEVDLPGVDFIDSAVLQKLKIGRISMDSARRELIRRSAATWVRRLPADVQCHHGYSDADVPSEELVRLQSALQGIGRSIDARFHPNRDHSSVLFAALPEVRIFVSRVLLH